MKRSKFEIGQFLTTTDGTKTFIHDGYETGDGYGVVIGKTSDKDVEKASGYGNYCIGTECRPATEAEIEALIQEIHNESVILDY